MDDTLPPRLDPTPDATTQPPAGASGMGHAPCFPATRDMAPFALQAGETVANRYVLTRLLGRGGMGEVWAAEQIAPILRRIALKLVRAGMDTADVLARFTGERQALAQMSHEHVARVYDAGVTAAGRPFFSMELVEGAPLTTYCDQHSLTLRQRLALFVLVCDAIEHAHTKGLIHRDLKPFNVLVADIDGKAVPKVIDFGIAKAMGVALHDMLHDNGNVTEAGQVVGTPEYMSPEQALGAGVDTRSDVYALGAGQSHVIWLCGVLR